MTFIVDLPLDRAVLSQYPSYQSAGQQVQVIREVTDY